MSMRIVKVRLAQAEPVSSGPKWVPVPESNWPWIAGVATVAAGAAALAFFGRKKKK
jgi:hypothetical protein